MSDHRAALSYEQRVQKTIDDAIKLVGSTGPVEIIDQDAYDEFIRLCNNPIFHPPKNTVKLSNGKEISLGNLDHYIKKMVYDLPKDEQRAVMNKRKLYNTLLNTRNAKLRQAYKMQVKRSDTLSTRYSQFAQREKQIIELFGRMFSIQEVHEMCVREWKIPATAAMVGDFRNAHWKEIQSKIEVHKRDYSDIRLGYKRSRLEELTWLYLTRKSIYEGTKKAEDHRLLLATIEQIRKEIEGDSLRIDGKISMDIEVTIQEQMRKELFRFMPLKEIILARIAARSNMPVDVLVADLNKSYYGKYLQGSVVDISHEEITDYPSSQTYDFNRIQIMHAKADKEKETVNVIDKAKETAKAEKDTSVKQLLQSVVKQSQDKLNFTTSSAVAKLIEKRNRGEVTEYSDKKK